MILAHLAGIGRSVDFTPLTLCLSLLWLIFSLSIGVLVIREITKE